MAIYSAVPESDVSLNAKIRILKQITTKISVWFIVRPMLVSMQRYEF